VIKINPETQEVTTIGGPFEGRQKWYGGLKSSNGCIYGIPQRASGIIKIDPQTQAVTTIGRGLSEGGWKWHGGVVSEDRTIIYGIPSNAGGR
jgi:hypothetical protein